MNPSLFQRLDAIAPHVTPNEYGVMLELALQYYDDPAEFEMMLGSQLEIVEQSFWMRFTVGHCRPLYPDESPTDG